MGLSESIFEKGGLLVRKQVNPNLFDFISEEEAEDRAIRILQGVGK